MFHRTSDDTLGQSRFYKHNHTRPAPPSHRAPHFELHETPVPSFRRFFILNVVVDFKRVMQRSPLEPSSDEVPSRQWTTLLHDRHRETDVACFLETLSRRPMILTSPLLPPHTHTLQCRCHLLVTFTVAMCGVLASYPDPEGRCMVIYLYLMQDSLLGTKTPTDM
jgi:hypothetical protein